MMKTKKGLFRIAYPVLFAAALLLVSGGQAFAAPELTYHGQFRINYYTDSRSETETFGDENAAAARLRFRPTFDVKINEDVSTHMQLNIGHIKENTSNARYNNSGDPAVGLRHAVIQAKLSDNVIGVAGLVPVSDKFGDTLFSGDWDFNPLTVAFVGDISGIGYRIGVAKLIENSENDMTTDSAKVKDDLDAYVFDVDAGGLGASVYYLDIQKGVGDGSLAIYGLRYATDLGGVKLNAFVMGSSLSLSGGDNKANGVAAKVEAKVPVSGMTLGVMGLYASGDKDYGTAGKTTGSFITPMSLIGHHGYWGYTGKLNIQGPTDTGIDDPVNIDGGSYGNANLGMGLTTVQANLDIPVSDKLGVYLAAGWFQSNDAKANASKDIGMDVYAQGKYKLGEALNLEFGVDYAALGAGSHMTVAADKSRNITTVFSRLQLEY
ncbi:MAG: hypothetical protein HZB29_04410 [Nitrospinae bacterium]|nr:hypothetical protein [Nitrospinota bacterium]